ncbi:MAG: hypothetical protein H8E35_05170 [Ardenticatenia bacterium]|nr:hypothetical protein [Ardenticatenia bacterium]
MLSDEQIEAIHLAMLELLDGAAARVNGRGDVYEMALLIASSQEQLQQAPSMLGIASSPSGPGRNPEPLPPEIVLEMDRVALRWK